MNKLKSFTLLFFLIFTAFAGGAQEKQYKYSLDLTKVQDDMLQVNLKAPPIDRKEIVFNLPAIIPGTYRISNYGQFIHNLQAFDKKGKNLPVQQLDTNNWKISKANKLSHLTYMVEDIFDTKQENSIYYMSGTNINEGQNFVINTPGFFGYFEGMTEIPFEVTITKPEGFYGSTGLIPQSTSPERDVYFTGDYDLLMDSPMMYNVPDTTFIEVGNAKVLISVYSPAGAVSSEFLAEKFDKLLQADMKYLGGKLPVDKYAFLLYFENPATARMDRAGALEHSYSSFYYLPEYPQEQLAPLLVDIAAHEFFHIVTPLTIHSTQIEDFNYNEAELSRHLWLYEGVTEYASDHVQVRYNLIPPQEFLDKLAEKINNSKNNYKDDLPFTELSQQAADVHADQYGNVYEKGALIGALLDIKLLELSNNEYDLQKLLRELSQRYGKNKPFEDDKLFDIIEEMTYPETGHFLRTYVSGPEELPYEEYFAKAGVDFRLDAGKTKATLGNIILGFNPEMGKLEVSETNQMNEFGKAIGVQKGDLIIKLQGQEVTPQTAQQILDAYASNTKEGDTVELVVSRKNEAGEFEEKTLSAPAQLVSSKGMYTLSLMENPTFEQLKLRNHWLQANPVTAQPADVNSVDAVISTLYDVISGPAGERNRERFYSLFKPEARMQAMAPTGSGPYMVSMTPQEYQEKNAPFFLKSAFIEEEIGRKETRFGEIAHVWSAFQFRTKETGEPEERGINSIQLVYDQNRWWITNLLWNSETPENQIPKEMLEKEPDTGTSMK